MFLSEFLKICTLKNNKQSNYKIIITNNKMKGYIVYINSTIIENQTYVQIFGRLENGQSFITLNKMNPYFFLEEKDLEKIKKVLEKYKIEKTNLKNFHEEELIKISSENQESINKLTEFLHSQKINTYEADIKPHIRFLIDKDILGTINIEGDYETAERVERFYKNPEITPVYFKPTLKIVSIDIETSKNSSQLFCIGVYSDKEKKNFLIGKEKEENIVNCSSEEDCLEKFKSYIIKLDPDIITGWNIINFDLKYLQEKHKKYKISFDIGRNNSEIKIRIEKNFFRSSSAEIIGRQVLDGLTLIKDPFIQEAPTIKNAKFDSYTLENVSQEILKTGKLIKGKSRHDEIEELYKKDKKKLVEYNLLDCELAYKILEKTGILNLAIERSQLTGLPLDKLTASIAAFDSLYIRKAHKKNLASPTTRYSSKEEKIKGGYVQQANPGIYHNVLVLDFKSLYPSIIRTFNIDPSSFLEKKAPNTIESPNKAYFKNTDGILPEIIESLHKEREKAKSEKRELSSYAIKIIMNSFFGVLASPNCRYFNFDMANAITHFGQYLIKLTAEKINKKGFNVIYSDTDSVFVETNLEKIKANKLGEEIQKEINDFYKIFTKKEYNRESFLELEFEKQYLSLMIPKVRNLENEKGAKKRYAGLIEKNGKEELEIVGLEAIRGDWTEAAQEFQKELLIKAFHKEPIEKFIQDYIKKIKSGKLDSQLIYKKSIRKNLNDYTKTTPPHVKAARQLDSLDSNIIQYYITTKGPEPIQKLKNKLDYEHYIEKQIKPIANQILHLVNKEFEDIEKNSKQAKLF